MRRYSGVGLLLSLASGLFMGLVPAMRASRVALAPSLAQHGKGVAGPSGTLVRHAIVVAQMALATMLLVGAALLLQSFVRLQQVRPGFDPEGVITARISLPRAQYPDASAHVGLSGADCWNRSTACHRYSPWRSGSRRHSGPACARAARRGTVPKRLCPRTKLRGSGPWSTW